MIKIGELAPDFTLPRDGGDTVTLSALRPSWVVLYFYPKDNTPGCTTQAIAFTQQLQAFRDAGCEIIGVSKDSVKKHDNFRNKHDLGITLASDAEADVCERYGVWKEKSMYGKTFMGIERSTFLIGTDGMLLQEWRKVRVPNHVEAVLDTVRSA